MLGLATVLAAALAGTVTLPIVAVAPPPVRPAPPEVVAAVAGGAKAEPIDAICAWI